MALAIVVSVPATALMSVSNTPLFKLSNSMFVIVLLSASIDLFVSVSVVALPTSVSAPVGNVIVPEFEILLIIGVVSVLFVSVCVCFYAYYVLKSVYKITHLMKAFQNLCFCHIKKFKI